MIAPRCPSFVSQDGATRFEQATARLTIGGWFTAVSAAGAFRQHASWDKHEVADVALAEKLALRLRNHFERECACQK